MDNWHSTWELKVVNVAEDLAQRCLDLGDFDGAVWAAKRGLRASNIEPRLTKLLMKAYVAKGDRKAAEQVFESHQAALDGLDLDDADAGTPRRVLRGVPAWAPQRRRKLSDVPTSTRPPDRHVAQP